MFFFFCFLAITQIVFSKVFVCVCVCVCVCQTKGFIDVPKFKELFFDKESGELLDEDKPFFEFKFPKHHSEKETDVPQAPPDKGLTTLKKSSFFFLCLCDFYCTTHVFCLVNVYI